MGSSSSDDDDLIHVRPPLRFCLPSARYGHPPRSRRPACCGSEVRCGLPYFRYSRRERFRSPMERALLSNVSSRCCNVLRLLFVHAESVVADTDAEDPMLDVPFNTDADVHFFAEAVFDAVFDQRLDQQLRHEAAGRRLGSIRSRSGTGRRSGIVEYSGIY